MFQSVDEVLQAVKARPSWADYRQVERLRQIWPTLVGETVANHTRPIRISRKVLHVATSSPAWAQNLAYQRRLILKKLSPHLSAPINDIRFRPGEWQESINTSNPFSSTHAYQPSYLSPPTPPTSPRESRPETPHEAFQSWAKRAKASQLKAGMSPCPACRCPAPEDELKRYSICSFCYREQP